MMRKRNRGRRRVQSGRLLPPNRSEPQACTVTVRGTRLFEMALFNF
jgi:hypothetical protein